MIHLFKHSLDRVDIFVYGIDADKRLITYEARDKEKGMLMEPRHTSPYEILDGKVCFDSIRWISLPTWMQMAATLS